MDIIYGLSGVVALAGFAAVLRLSAREASGQGTRPSDYSWMDDDPNSTLSVTREVVGEKLDRRWSELLSAEG